MLKRAGCRLQERSWHPPTKDPAGSRENGGCPPIFGRCSVAHTDLDAENVVLGRWVHGREGTGGQVQEQVAHARSLDLTMIIHLTSTGKK